MWTSFFEAIGSLFSDVLMKPMDWLAELELSNWWVANAITWIFIIICSVAFVYWLKRLSFFASTKEDDQDTTAHSFLK
ncbi:uracil phosphoribosyltransferase [Flavobacterium sp. xlx-214]|uniref:DUF6341 family protein n=1 Tax=unclassified Flavobacterium TaxID=196869 RepID=UPI0013D3767F|nr:MULTISPECIES: uracil phosphoribosyltransferase [unclassified Flavobacterium]MBA5792192.1 uracil phosphoribosyltransferase [Flavobacterium sp. xlx-221]QMI84435.1 uracil phosphoribosyltransferase [Flavobacterium sp. xlx-214]